LLPRWCSRAWSGSAFGFGVWLVGLAATGGGGWLDRLVSALGGLAAVMLVPVANLFAPVPGAAAFRHVVHRAGLRAR
jgi:hypothetical protein